MQSCDLQWQGVWRCFLSLQKLLSFCNSKDLLSLSSFKSVINFDFFNVLTAQLTPYCYHIIPITLETNNFFFSPAFKCVPLISFPHSLLEDATSSSTNKFTLKLFRINKMFSGHFFHSYCIIYELSVCMFFIHLFSELGPCKISGF